MAEGDRVRGPIRVVGPRLMHADRADHAAGCPRELSTNRPGLRAPADSSPDKACCGPGSNHGTALRDKPWVKSNRYCTSGSVLANQACISVGIGCPSVCTHSANTMLCGPTVSRTGHWQGTGSSRCSCTTSSSAHTRSLYSYVSRACRAPAAKVPASRVWAVKHCLHDSCQLSADGDCSRICVRVTL